MTIQEAIKSGKPFKRKSGGNSWREFDAESLSRLGYRDAPFTFDEILADDWEIEEEKIEITKHLALNAVRSAYSSPYTVETKIDESRFLKELGFKS